MANCQSFSIINSKVWKMKKNTDTVKATLLFTREEWIRTAIEWDRDLKMRNWKHSPTT